MKKNHIQHLLMFLQLKKYKQTMKYLIIFLCLLIPNFSYSQGFPSFKDNPSWHVLVWEDTEASYAQTNVVYYLKDTTLCGQVYSVLKVNHPQIGFHDLHFFIRTQQEQVYLRTVTDCGEPEYLLYDFSAQMGDTLQVAFRPYGESDDPAYMASVPVVVDSVYYAVYEGVDRRQIDVRPFDPFPNDTYGAILPSTWIWGVGTKMHPIYPVFHNYGSFETSFDLLCYDSSGINIFKNSKYNTCDTTINGLIGINNSIYNDIKIFPNPFNNQISINSANNDFDAYKLIDISGKTIMQGTLNNKAIKTESLNRGIYLISVYSPKNQLFINKKIVKR